MSIRWERPMVGDELCETSACVEVAPAFAGPAHGCDSSSCVEVAPVVVEPCGGGECVEAHAFEGGALVRDSKLGDDSPVLRFTRDEWRAFRKAMIAGQFAYDEQRELAAL